MKQIATVTAKQPSALDAIREKMNTTTPDKASEWINMLVYGVPGAGKTHLLGTAEDSEDTSPVLIIDIDGGLRTIRKRTGIDVLRARSYMDVRRIWNDLYNAVDSDGKLPYKTIGVDSLSELVKIDLQQINEEFAKGNSNIDPEVPDQRSYYKGGIHITKTVRNFRDLPCNVIFTAHENQGRDNFNRITRIPQFYGKLVVDIPGFLDIVGHLRVETTGDQPTRYLQTTLTETTSAKDRNNAFDPVEQDPTIPSLWAKLKAIQ